MLNCLKDYIALKASWNSECYIEPQILYLAGGGVFAVDRILDIVPSATRRSGGFGQRYKIRATCEEEEAYGKLFYVFFEIYGTVGHWVTEESIVDATVVWDTNGQITPVSFSMDDTVYNISKLHRKYPMSTRKTDGSGMRYIVSTVSPDGYHNDITYLMLEHGGKLVGHWYYEAI